MIKLIVAYDMNRVIGSNGEMPWGTIPMDLKYFKELTEGHTVVMGRKTAQSIGKSLPNRLNIVLSRHTNNEFTMSSIDDVVIAYEKGLLQGDLWVIGGEQIYRAFLERGLVEEAHVTTILQNYKGDTFFPPLGAYADWEKVDGKLKRVEGKNLSIIFQKFRKIADK